MKILCNKKRNRNTDLEALIGNTIAHKLSKYPLYQAVYVYDNNTVTINLNTHEWWEFNIHFYPSNNEYYIYSTLLVNESEENCYDCFSGEVHRYADKLMHNAECIKAIADIDWDSLIRQVIGI